MHTLNEAQTRKQLIDHRLETARWDVADPAKVGIEVPTDRYDAATWRKMEAKLRRDQKITEPLPAGICDYVLYRENGEILAVVEAKRTSVDPRLAEAQTRFYVEEIEKRQSFRPFGFMTNGYDIYFQDFGTCAKRQVQGFFTREDLENQLFFRTNAIPLTQAEVNTDIVDRAYQLEAIQRICETFERGRRKALLVMATGTGKTRTAMALSDVFLQTHQALKILFIADRDALVEQAKEEGFKEFLPHEPFTRIYSHDIRTDNRLYAVTLQTISNCYQRFSPSFFDLVIFDEVHRSIFNKWNDVLHYFDARMIGLTATPADFIDRNTFLAFECFEDRPTFFYSYQDAIDDGYLVDHDIYQAQTRFQRKGIHGADLSEEDRNVLIEQGIDPDDLHYEGTELERTVTNRDTTRRQWQEFMDTCYRDPAGLPCKTIVFALNQKHALRLGEVFGELFPQYHELVEVITYQSKHARTAIKRFKQKSLPRIAVSVDMLETGINVPEVMNLVFMRPVHSRIKLEQMIGRGTRTQAVCKNPEWLPEGGKTSFCIIDFWENEFDKPAEDVPAQSLPVLVSLFNTRIELMDHYLDDQLSPEGQQVKADLRRMVARIPTDVYEARQAWSTIAPAWEDGFWGYLTDARMELLRMHVGPLLRYAPEVDVPAETFIHKVERLKLRVAQDKDVASLARDIAENVAELPEFVQQDPDYADSIRLCRQPRAISQASVTELRRIVDDLAQYMKQRRHQRNELLHIDLPDEMEIRGYVVLDGIPEPVYAQEYRQRVEDAILNLVGGHPTVEALARGERVSDARLLDLERTLRHELTRSDLHLTESNIRRAYRDQGLEVGSLIEFLRYLLDLDGVPSYAEIVLYEFSQFMTGDAFNADQMRFLRAVQSVFLQKRRLALADLYASPLDQYGMNAVERLFTQDEINQVLVFAQTLTIE